MPTVLFGVDVNATELSTILAAYPKAAQDLEQAFDVVAADLAAAVVDRIDSSGDGTWPPNAPSTIAIKGSSKPMFDTGQLYGSIRGEAGPDWAKASTSVGYIVFHLDGGPVIPKRNPFELGEDVFEEAAQFIAQSVVERAQQIAGR